MCEKCLKDFENIPKPVLEFFLNNKPRLVSLADELKAVLDQVNGDDPNTIMVMDSLGNAVEAKDVPEEVLKTIKDSQNWVGQITAITYLLGFFIGHEWQGHQEEGGIHSGQSIQNAHQMAVGVLQGATMDGMAYDFSRRSKKGMH